MAEATEEQVLEAVENIKTAFSDGFQFDDISTVLEEAAVFAELFSLTGGEKKALALRVIERVLEETNIPFLPDKLVLPFVGDIGADALIMKFAPGLLDKIVNASAGKLAINKRNDS